MPVSELGKDSNGKPGDFTKVSERTEWTGEHANFMVSIWKITGLNLCFLGGNTFPSN